MSDTVITIISIFVVAVLMLVYPLLAVSERNEDVTQLAVQTIVSEFVDTAATAGKIRESDYDGFVQKLAATGNTYDIVVEIQHLDENPGKKAATTSPDMLGENVRYSTFGSAIFASDSYKNGGYPLKKGDIIIVNVKNNNTTIAQLLRKFFYSVTGQGTYQVGASASSMVVNNGR